MAAVHEILEVLGRAESGGGGEVVAGLVAPGLVERVLGHGHELDVGEAQVGHIGDKLVGQFVVAEEIPVVRPFPAPGAEVHFIDAHRLVQGKPGGGAGGASSRRPPTDGRPGPRPTAAVPGRISA